MSTNINSNGLPDTAALEKLANELFTALPTDFLSGFSNPVTDNRSVLLQQGNVVDLKEPQSSLPDPSFLGSGQVPKSVAGSGVSPSAVNQGNSVDLQNPQTSLPDPNAPTTGGIPASVAGSGISPSLKEGEINNAGYKTYLDQSLLEPSFQHNFSDKTPTLAPVSQTAQYLPFEAEQPFQTVLNDILKGINVSSPQHPLPSTLHTGLGVSPYYFLTERGFPIQGQGQQPQAVSQKGISSLISPPFDVNVVRKDFPILQETVNGRPLIWLDNAATTQKPRQVIERISHFYEHENSNIHRAAHELAARSTDAYEGARSTVKNFINAGSVNEIVFVRGTTEAINLVAKSWGAQYLNSGDEIVLSHLEHHANIVPWQQLASKKGLKIKVIPVDDDGQILLEEYAKLLGPKTKLVSFTQVSNALGTITPAQTMVAMAHAVGAKVLVDGAQSVSHIRTDVKALDADWFVFSGHKIFGPTGIGVLYGKEALLNETQPWQGGGNMIVDVTFEHTVYHKAPGRFEAGTGNIADAVGLGAALDYVNKWGIDLIGQYEHYLLLYATNLLKEVPGLRQVGTAAEKASVLSFTLKGYSNDEVGQALNKEGIAVRTGHHCAQPILRRFGLESTVRPSLAFYNTCAEIDTLVSILHRLSSQKK